LDPAREAIHPQHVSDLLHGLALLRSMGLTQLGPQVVTNRTVCDRLWARRSRLAMGSALGFLL
jgi:hypothetical protein